MSDSGTSLELDVDFFNIKKDASVASKTFGRTTEEQLQYVKSFDWINFSALAAAISQIKSFLSQEFVARYISPRRSNLIEQLLLYRIEVLRSFVSN